MLFILKISDGRDLEKALLADSKPSSMMDLWHVRMGHPHDGALRRMISATTGVKLPVNMQVVFL
jgi:hypothetical protein